MKVKQVFEGVYTIDGKLATLNLVKGNRVYGEELAMIEGNEYRLWNPYRSKLSAAIINGMKHMLIKKGSHVLYLGAATGTTSSHVSDIVGKEGIVYCIEISERNMRELVKVCEIRKNMLPMLHDARDIGEYEKEIGTCDILYQDISSRDQADILRRNSMLLKKKGTAYVAIKSQSIDVTRRPAAVFEEFLNEINPYFTILERISIEPYSMMHLFVVLQKK
ncbi:MAG: fibrillarin-like rRNA/tRNA 2'-O-methyltransferase [Candidatus Micrarchaeales archaeon]|jgi:fibrillarin-like pre-rRNA processing protein